MSRKKIRFFLIIFTASYIILIMTSHTNSIGPNKINLSTTVPVWLDEKIRELAASSGLSRNKYILRLLEEALKNNPVIEQKLVYRMSPSTKKTATDRKREKNK